MKMRKSLCLFLALLLVLSLCACGSEKKEPQTADAAVVTKGKDLSKDEVNIFYIPMSTAMENTPVILSGMEKVIQNYKNVKITTLDAQFDPAKQIEMINEAITEKVDGIIIQCADSVALNSAITEAQQAGIVFMTLNMGCEVPTTAHIFNSDYNSGYLAGEYLDKQFNGEGNVLVLDVPVGLKTICPVMTGFTDYCEEHHAFNILQIVGDDTTVEKGYTITRDLLTKYDDVDIIYCAHDGMALGALQAVKAMGRENEGIKILGNEGAPANLAAIKNGELYGTLAIDPYYEAYAMTAMMLFCISSGINGYALGFTETPKIELPSMVCTQENIDEVIATTHWDLSGVGLK